MKTTIQKFVLFGATGDLSQRMVWPSLYHLCREKLVPPTLTFIASARNPMPNDEFRKFVDGALRKHVPAEYLKEDAVADLLTRITYAPFEAGEGSAKGSFHGRMIRAGQALTTPSGGIRRGSPNVTRSGSQ